MSSYQEFTSTRLREPDPVALLNTLRGGDATIGVQHDPGSIFVLKKNTAWTPGQIAAAQVAIDNAPALTPQRIAQNEIDQWPIAMQALVLALIDQLNMLRSRVSPPLQAVTPAQALQAIRDKAGAL